MRKRVIPAVAAAAVVMAGLATPVAAATAVAEPADRTPSFRDQAERYRPTGRLQVKFKDGVGATRRAAALSRVTARGQSVRVDRTIPGLNAAVLSVSDARAVQALLRAEADVEFVEPESRYKAFEAEPVTAEITEIGANLVHTAATPNVGAGTQIAVLDSPVDSTNPDLDNGKVVYSANFTTDVPDTDGTTDSACTAAACPHGTAVAAAAAATAGDGNLSGVAPGASIRSYNVFRRFVMTNPTDPTQTYETVGASSGDIAAALDAVATHAAADPSIVAVNMSLGGPFDNQLIRTAIAGLRAAAPRVTVVVAAGNDGGERANFPAGDPYVLSVGATGQVTTDSCAVAAAPSTPWTLASFSNRGDVDVTAPGHCVNLWYPPTNEETGAVSGPATVTKGSGTSFAAPMVAGVAALLAKADPPVVGDAARAAIIAGATAPATQSTGIGEGAVKAPAAITLGTGTAPYTSLSVDRGGSIATLVGRRNVEALRVDPTGAAAPAAATLGVTSGYGSFSGVSSSSAGNVTRTTGTFAVPAVDKTGASFALTATGTTDAVSVPMKMLGAGNNYEGLPAASGEATSVALTYGTSSAYVRSAAVGDNQQLDWDFTFDENGWMNSADLFAWEPATDGATADAAMEPIASHWNPDALSGFNYVIPNEDVCELREQPEGPRLCNRGRWLVGWVTFGPDDSSVGTSRYKLVFTYSGPTVAAVTPAIASTTSTTGPFTVSWSGNTKATKYDVSYAVKTKVGTTWKLGAWIPWKSKTTAKSASFGTSRLPTTVVPGRTYHFRVQSFDSLGNPSLATTKVTNAPFDDRSSSIVYSTGSTAWTNVSVTGRWLSTAKKSSIAGARAAMTTDTSAFSIVGDRCAACGQFKVYVDGVLKKTVDTYKSTTATRQVLWSSGSLGSVKSHRVTVIVVGTKGRPKVVLDGVSILR